MDKRTNELIIRLKQIGEGTEPDVGKEIIMNLRNIKGTYVVEEITDDKSFPITIKPLQKQDNRRRDINLRQYMIGRLRRLSD